MGHFILKERSIVLHKSDPNKDRSFQISGDVAQLADGRLFARFELPGEGGPVIGCREWNPGEDPRKVPRPGVHDDWAWQRQRWESFIGGWMRWNRSGEPDERARFAAAWPTISSFLGVAPEQEHWEVETGDTYYPRNLSVPRWRDFIDRHSSGLLGLYGEIPADPVDHSTAWTITLQPPAIRARHALDTGLGVIRSRWIPADQSPFPKPEYLTTAKWSIDIVTVYSAAGRRTLIDPVLHPNGISNDDSHAA
jgi:hypothetical protein